MVLTDADKREFAERGYILVPAVLSRREVDAAMTVVDDLIAETPPPEGHYGHHFYWPALKRRLARVRRHSRGAGGHLWSRDSRRR